MFHLALKSLINRKGTVVLTLLSMSLSVALLLGIEQVRSSVKSSFLQTVSGIDLIVGARGGSLQLLLYSVFRLGDATNNLSWESYERWATDPRVEWSIPLSLGDSHRGFRVLGTTAAYWQHYRFGKNQPLTFAQGVPFHGLLEAVLGSQVAKKLGYQVGESIIIAHGTGNAALFSHEEQPFRVVGILKPTGTPVDQTVHVSLAAIEAIHIGWESGIPSVDTLHPPSELNVDLLVPQSITAALVKLKSRMHTFRWQREVNSDPKEPLQAILPGVTLQQLWQVLNIAEQSLLAMSALVVLSSLIGLISLLLAGLNERRRELAILRSVGAGPGILFLLLWIESSLLCLGGVIGGIVLNYGILILLQPMLEQTLGLGVTWQGLGKPEGLLLLGVLSVGFLLSLIPAWRAYRHSLHDGLLPRN